MEIIHNETIDNILDRRSVRFYTEEKLTDSEIATLLECAKWAPSSRNGQPCSVFGVTRSEFLRDMNIAFKDFVGWDTPAYTNWDKSPFYQNAPAMFFIFSTGNNMTDAGIMVENLAIAAQGLGLNSVIIGSVGGFLNNEASEELRKQMGVPDNLKFQISIAVGHGTENPVKKPRINENFKIAVSD